MHSVSSRRTGGRDEEDTIYVTGSEQSIRAPCVSFVSVRSGLDYHLAWPRPPHTLLDPLYFQESSLSRDEALFFAYLNILSSLEIAKVSPSGCLLFILTPSCHELSRVNVWAGRGERKIEIADILIGAKKLLFCKKWDGQQVSHSNRDGTLAHPSYLAKITC